MITHTQVIPKPMPKTGAKAVAEYSLSWHNLSVGQCSKLQLDRNQIHLWIVRLAELMEQETPHNPPSLTIPIRSGLSASTLPAFNAAELLTTAENTRARKIIDNLHRQHYLGGRAGLRILLSAYTGIANADLEFGYGSRGKPSLLNTVAVGRLAFNYTLSSGYALYAFAWNRQLGVDIEVFPRSIAVNRLAKRILTKSEQTAWNTVHKQQQNQAMLACWTRKEAYGKLLGVGIRYTMNQVDLCTDLQRVRWLTEVAGLFDQQVGGQKQPTKQYSEPLRGVQLGLPVAGVASLMYAEDRTLTGCQTMHDAPALSAFQLRF